MERAEFTALAESEPSRFTELDRLFPSAASAAMFEGLPKPCPVCRTVQLERVEILPGVSPLTCAQCGGVWLQSGEPGLRDSPETAGLATREIAPAGTSASDIAAGQFAPDSDATVASPPPVEEPADTFIYEPDAIGPTDIIEPPSKPDAEPATVKVPHWLPPVSAAMPDPRPPSRRGAPLVAEASADQTVAMPPVYTQQRWCPQCRRSYHLGEAECSTCGVGLAESNYRVRCLRCGNENTISAERCWSCQAKMHPDSDTAVTPAPPPLPRAADLRRLKNRTVGRPPSAASCGGSVLVWVIGGSIAVGLIMALLER